METTMGKLVKVLKAIGRFVNRAIIEMTADRPGGGMSTTRERVENLPPD